MYIQYCTTTMDTVRTHFFLRIGILTPRFAASAACSSLRYRDVRALVSALVLLTAAHI